MTVPRNALRFNCPLLKSSVFKGNIIYENENNVKEKTVHICYKQLRAINLHYPLKYTQR